MAFLVLNMIIFFFSLPRQEKSQSFEILKTFWSVFLSKIKTDIKLTDISDSRVNKIG